VRAALQRSLCAFTRAPAPPVLPEVVAIEPMISLSATSLPTMEVARDYVKGFKCLHGFKKRFERASLDKTNEQMMARHLKETGVEIPWAQENTDSVGIYFNDPNGNRLEVYNEEPGGSRWAWEGQYSSKILV
jgi:hypothetical protein